jgi:hypothetical protein
MKASIGIHSPNSPATTLNAQSEAHGRMWLSGSLRLKRETCLRLGEAWRAITPSRVRRQRFLNRLPLQRIQSHSYEVQWGRGMRSYLRGRRLHNQPERGVCCDER